MTMAAIDLANVHCSYFIRKSSTSARQFERGAVGAPILIGRQYIEIKAVKGVSLSLSEGNRTGLIGTNGSGKSTLLKLCAKALVPQSGTVDINGIISPQFDLGSGLKPALTGRSNAELKCLYMGVPQKDIPAYVDEVGAISGLGGYFDLPMKSYSAGMKSRLIMSLLRLVRGEILIMDEWINAVDPTLNETIGGLQAQLIDQCKILMLASHSERVLKEWVKDLVWLEQGEVHAFGEVNQVYAEYKRWIRRKSS